MPRGALPAAIVLSLLALVVIAGSAGGRATAGNGNGPEAVPPEIQADFDADGEVIVIVALENEDVLDALRARTGGGRANGQAQAEAAAEFRGRIDNVVVGLPADAGSVEPYEQFGAFSITVRDQRVLDFLARHPLVKGLEPVREVQTQVASSLLFINQGGVAAAGLTGAGTSVAIIDTGINFSHSFFGSCTAPGVPSGCRVPVAMEFGDADGNLQDDLGHGTNVAGIAGSVASKTSLLSLDVFTKSCSISGSCSWGASTPDILDGLNWVIANAATYNTKAVNLSLGSTTTYSLSCDTVSAATTNAFGSLRAIAVLPVIAAGNNANKNGVSWPACVTGAHAVGAVYDGDYGTRSWGACGSQVTGPDVVACFSNSHATLLHSLAPGAFIDVAGTQNFTGTSMAAPHVAGAAAALSNVPATLTQVENALTSTGPLVTDTNGVAKRRLDLCQAAASFGTRDPEFSSTPVTQVSAGHPYSYKLLACGFGLNVTFQLIEGPPGLSMNASGLITWAPTAANVGLHQVTVQAQSGQGTTQQTWNLEVKPFNLLFALQNGQTLSGVSMADEDIVAYDGTAFTQFFDGSDVGISGTEIAAFEVIDSDEVLLVFRTQETVTGAGTVDDSDIVKFTGTLGPATSGTFSLYFDGSDVGLAGGSFSDTEKIDALGLRGDGHLLVSTNGTVSVSGASGSGEDVLKFAPTGLGSTTTGSWAVYWDGSDVGFDTTENLDGVSLLENRLYFSTTQAFSVPGPSGQNEDVFVCRAVTSGASSFCGGWEIFFDGSLFGLGNNNVVDLDFPPPPPAPTAPTITSTAPLTATVGQQYTYQTTASGSAPITWSLTENPGGMTINGATGLVTWTPGAADVGQHSVEIQASNSGGNDTQLWTITVSDVPVVPEVELYFALGTAQTLSGISMQNEDIVAFDGTNFSLFFDGSDEGLGGLAIDAFDIIDSDEILLSFTAAGTVGGVSMDDSDVLRFQGTLGPATSGSFSMYLDGSDVGLSNNTYDAEDVDAVHLLPNGQVLLSTVNAVSVAGVSGSGHDVIRFIPTSTGANTAGSFAMYWDGSDVGLTLTAERLDAAGFVGGRLYLSSYGPFTLTGLSGDDEDVFVCETPTTGANSLCGVWSLFFDGSVHDLAANDIVAIDVP